MMMQRVGYSVYAVVSPDEAIEHLLSGWVRVEKSAIPKPSAWVPSAKDSRGFTSAPDYIGQEVRLSDHLSITLGWVKE
jgi:hypothetical protein